MKKGTLIKLLGMLMCVTLLASFVAGCNGSGKDTSSDTSASDTASDTSAETSSDTSVAEYGQFDDVYIEDEHNIADANGEIWSTSNRTATMSSSQWNEGLKNLGCIYNPDATYDLPISTTGESLDIWIGLGMLNTAITSYSENDTYKYISELTGITQNFIHPTYGQESTEFGIMVASGDWPDIARYDFDENKGEAYVNDGIYYDMQYMVRDWMPNYRWRIREIGMERDAGSDSGKIWRMYYIEDPQELPWQGLLVRKDMMDEAGITAYPETLSDWDTFFQQMQDYYGEGKGTVNAGNSFLCDNSEWMSAWNVAWNFYVDETGTVGYGCYTDAYKEFCLKMNEWWNKGFIDANFASRAAGFGAISNDDMNAKLMSVVMGAFGVAHAQYETISGGAVKGIWYDPVVAPVMNSGDIQHFRRVSTPLYNCSVVMGDTANPVLVAKYYDWLYTDDGGMILTYGVPEKHWVINSDGLPDGTEYSQNAQEGLDYDTVWKYRVQAGWWYIGVLANDWWAFVNQGDYSREKLASMDMTWYYSGEVWGKAAGDFVYPRFASLTGEESSEYAELYNDINTYVTEMTPQFIMGIVDINAEYDNFIATMKEMGIETCIQYKQNAYDRYSAR
jgi:putative aldouronate transport system substrate-binding protein